MYALVLPLSFELLLPDQFKKIVMFKWQHYV